MSRIARANSRSHRAGSRSNSAVPPDPARNGSKASARNSPTHPRSAQGHAATAEVLQKSASLLRVILQKVPRMHRSLWSSSQTSSALTVSARAQSSRVWSASFREKCALCSCTCPSTVPAFLVKWHWVLSAHRHKTSSGPIMISRLTVNLA